MTQPIISTRDLTRRFGTQVAVDSLNLEILQGEIFGLVGPDGAGKSTALRLICGLMQPSSGEVIVAGHNVERDTGAVRQSIGYMAQRFGFYTDLTIDENVSFYGELRAISRSERQEFVPMLLKRAGLYQFRSREVGKLSGGMKQKLALVCTLLHRPRILVLDEPTNGLDPISRRELWFLLYELVKDGMTVLASTAYLDEAERCHRVGVMDRGRLILCDAPNRLRNLLTEECYELKGPMRRAILDAMQPCDGVVSVEPHGNSIHLLLDGSRTSRAILEETLAAGRVEVTSFQRIVPSLEDVFITTVTKLGQGTDGGVDPQ